MTVVMSRAIGVAKCCLDAPCNGAQCSDQVFFLKPEPSGVGKFCYVRDITEGPGLRPPETSLTVAATLGRRVP